MANEPPLCLSGGRAAVGALHRRGVSEEAGHEAADQHAAEPGVEGLGQRGGLHADGGHLPHAHGAAPRHGAPGQVKYLASTTETFPDDLGPRNALEASDREQWPSPAAGKGVKKAWGGVGGELCIDRLPIPLLPIPLLGQNLDVGLSQPSGPPQLSL